MANDTKATARYEVVWERIGRNHAVPPTLVTSADPDDIAEELYRVARPHLRSRDVEVRVDLESGRVQIICGFHNGGAGRIAAVSS